MSILILNDNEFFLDKARRYFTKRGFQIHIGNNGMDGLFYIVNYQPAAIITQINLNMLSGVDLYRMIKSKSNFNGKFFFISDKEEDAELEYYNEQHKVYADKTAFKKIFSQLSY